MHKTMEKVENLCKMQSKLTEIMQSELAKDSKDICTEEAGEVVDMIKDLADAEKNCWKALYYKKACEAMEEGEEKPELPWYYGPMGYDNWRYSSGRFAPKGHGHRTGRMGYPDPKDLGYDPMWPDNMTTGYPMHDEGKMWPNDGRNFARSKYGHEYDMFLDSKRHYTETHSPEDKEKMKQHGREHVMETVDTIKEIWAEADPDLRRQMKESIVTLVNDMK